MHHLDCKQLRAAVMKLVRELVEQGLQAQGEHSLPRYFWHAGRPAWWPAKCWWQAGAQYGRKVVLQSMYKAARREYRRRERGTS